jgi:hypothetical protein
MYFFFFFFSPAMTSATSAATSSTAATRFQIAVLTDEPSFVESLATALSAHATVRVLALNSAHPLVFGSGGERAPSTLLVNRVSARAGGWSRKAADYVSVASQRCGAWVNGRRCQAIAASKLAQAQVVFEAGLAQPTSYFLYRDDATSLAFAVPEHGRWLLKPSVGAYGSQIRVLDNKSTVPGDDPAFAADGIALVQERISPPDRLVHRAELLDGELLYVVSTPIVDNSFDYCVKDVRPGQTISATCDDAVFRDGLRRLAELCDMQVGAVEYLIDAQGRKLIIDINPVSSYSPLCKEKLGFDPLAKQVASIVAVFNDLVAGTHQQQSSGRRAVTAAAATAAQPAVVKSVAPVASSAPTAATNATTNNAVSSPAKPAMNNQSSDSKSPAKVAQSLKQTNSNQSTPNKNNNGIKNNNTITTTTNNNNNTNTNNHSTPNNNQSTPNNKTNNNLSTPISNNNKKNNSQQATKSPVATPSPAATPTRAPDTPTSEQPNSSAASPASATAPKEILPEDAVALAICTCPRKAGARESHKPGCPAKSKSWRCSKCQSKMHMTSECQVVPCAVCRSYAHPTGSPKCKAVPKSPQQPQAQGQQQQQQQQQQQKPKASPAKTPLTPTSTPAAATTANAKPVSTPPTNNKPQQ